MAKSEEPTLEITKTIRGNPPGLPFLAMKDAVLGKRYRLSLVFTGEKLSRTLNATHRGKDRPTDVLSFELEKDAGEIFINMPRTIRDARRYGAPLKKYLGFIFIHGLHHLKGLDHGSTMENQEEKIRRKFDIDL